LESGLIRKLSSAILKRWGSPSAKQKIWDSEYKTGKWDYLNGTPNAEVRDPIYEFLESYSAGGSILDLGCGSGATAFEMRNVYNTYTGVDVSEVAIEGARRAALATGERAAHLDFAVSDIFTFEPDHKFSVILFRESIYYVPQHKIKAMLERYRSHLETDGVIMVRLCDVRKYKSIINIMTSDFKGREIFASPNAGTSIFVCS
jgi:2-polyprenyl-3-methyl-5-hydroxy-6-metoxy-1,4-benzoquinol methylase